jgi:four helix bundle protein
MFWEAVKCVVRLGRRIGAELEVRGWRFEAKTSGNEMYFGSDHKWRAQWQEFWNLTRQGVPMADYVFPFEKLDVWQLAVDLAEFVLGLLDQIPRNKHIRLVSQMEAATTSPAQNIAEGKGRQYKKEFIQFLHIAQGSVYEVVTLNEVFRRKGLFDEEEAKEIRKRCEQVDRKLNGLINSLRGRKGYNPKVHKREA